MRCRYCHHDPDQIHPAVARRFDAIEAALSNMEKRIMAKIDDILTDVQDESTLDDSIITLLTNISQQLKDAGTDATKLQAVQDAIDANKAKISAAITANTPAA